MIDIDIPADMTADDAALVRRVFEDAVKGVEGMLSRLPRVDATVPGGWSYPLTFQKLEEMDAELEPLLHPFGRPAAAMKFNPLNPFRQLHDLDPTVTFYRVVNELAFLRERLGLALTWATRLAPE